MPIERQLPVVSAILIVLAAWMLALTGNGYLQASLATLLTIAAVVLNDFRRQVTLSVFYSNAAALTVFGVSVARIPSFSGDEILLAMTDALVFLQIVLMFKRKRAHDYWLLFLANLLEVAVAAALSLNYGFSVYLAIYTFLGVYGLGLLLLLTEHERFGKLAPLRRAPPASSTRWPLAGREPSFVNADSLRDLQSAVGIDFRRRMARVATWTLLLTGMLFFFMPRFAQTALPRFNAAQMVGFAEEMSLKDFGKINERADRVMRVHLTDAASGEALTLLDPPLWQGGVLETYERGEWSRPGPRTPAVRIPTEGDVDELPGLVRQQITVEPAQTTVVWSIFPPIRADYSGAIAYHDRRGQVLRVRSDQRFQCELFTLGVSNRRQVPLTPHRTSLAPARRDALLQMPPSVDGVDPLAALREIAAQIVAEIPAADTTRRARALEAYLSDATRFKYTLVLPKRESTVDPIVDFLTNQREGHCEFFASALALMLRAVDIPARVVVGYKGGEIDAITSAYDVKEADAHSWVEAYVDESQLSDNVRSAPLWQSLKNGEGVLEADGAWLRLDPTPFIAATDPAQQNLIWYLAREGVLYARAIWANYVIGLDASRQREMIYEPLQALVFAAFRSETWTNLAGAGGRWLLQLGRDMLAGQPRAWFVALLLLSVQALVIVGVTRGLRWLRRRWGQRSAHGGKQRQIVDVPVYRRLEAILARSGHKRRAETTPREFAFLVGGELSDSAETLAVAGVPRKIVEAFYRVRFGGESLAADELATLESALGQLAEALQKNRTRRAAHVAG